jgi:hypothetical protein
MTTWTPPGAKRKRADRAKPRDMVPPKPERPPPKPAPRPPLPEGWRPNWRPPKDPVRASVEYQRDRWERYDALTEESKRERAEAKQRAKEEKEHVELLGREQAFETLIGDGSFLGLLERINVRVTSAQRVLLGVCFDGWQPSQLSPEDLELFHILFGCDVSQVPEHFRRWLCWVIGGRSGKSYLGALAIFWRGLVSDLSSLAPGEDATGLIVCPDLRLARHTLKYIRGAIGLPQCAAALKVITDGADACVIERPDGKRVSFEALPATAGGGAVRARTLVAAMLDEAAFFRDEDYSVNDRDIYDAVDPRVTIPGGFVLVSSTPWAEAGLLHEEWKRDWGHPETGVCAHVTTNLMRKGNEMIEAAIARARIKNPKNAQREFDAVFGAVDSGLFFPQDAVREYTRTGCIVLPVEHKLRPIIVVDASLSQNSDDRFGWGVVTAASDPFERRSNGETRERRLVTVHEADAWEVDRQPREMAQRLRDEVCVRYGTNHIIIDQYSDVAFAQLCADVGLIADVVRWTGGDSDGSKAERFRRARTALQAGQVVICDSPRLLADLQACRGKLLPGGGETIGVPRTRRGHGDCLSAVILGISEAFANPGRFAPDELSPEDQQRAIEQQMFRAAQRRAKERRGHQWR